MGSRSTGFTLIEVLVALSVFAIAAIGLYSVSEQNVRNAARLEEKTMAHWVAMNKMVEIQTLPGWPSLGTQDTKVEMAQREWQVKTVVSKTTLKTLRKVEIRVGINNDSFGEKIKTTTVLTGYIGNRAI
ncbi:MAG: type II secretion system minor pseudopilin GspI [Pseudomonadales bacterium]|nr:type II secretion system minor pseudopilin GspI [Pseudomonadales bacterium]